MKTKHLFDIIFFLAAFSVVSACVSLPLTMPVVKQNKVRFLIDAGHGLPDGGALAADGTKESTLNLLIAQKLYALFPEEIALLIRRDENGVYTGGDTIRAKKISDMAERVRIAGKYPSAVIVSIHLNTFQNKSVHGCQVFYKENSDISKTLAESIQQNINQLLQPETPKAIKPIPGSLYLFKKTDNPALLIECGFLTNERDLENLKDDAYQKKLAQIIYDAVK